MIAGFGLPYRWTFTVLNSSAVNAGSLPDGEVEAYSGLVQLVGTNRGLWAAVLSHEIAHVARRHGVRKVLYHIYLQQQIEYWRLRARYGDKSAGWTAVGLQVAGAIAEKKLSRDLEHDADVQGMLLMARAGYHPDYVFAMHHLLRLATGEQSKFGAFFSDHPRWQTRDQRSDRAYLDALAEYNRLWPDPSLSPGGSPPLVAFVGEQKSFENKEHGTGDIVLALSCRNSSEPITLLVRLKNKDGQLITSDSGSSEIRRQAQCVDKDDAVPTVIHIRSTIAPKVKAQVDFLGPNNAVLERSNDIDVHLPKADKKMALKEARIEVEPAVQDFASINNKNESPTQQIALASSPIVPVRSDVQVANSTSVQVNTLPLKAISEVPKPIAVVKPSAQAIRGRVTFSLTPPQPVIHPGAELGVEVRNWAEGGVEVLAVAEGSPAEQAGIHVGDRIDAINGKKVTTTAGLDAELTNAVPGTPVRIDHMFRNDLFGWIRQVSVVTLAGHR
jgi:hypothetical protein